jgi:hypothetical protein
VGSREILVSTTALRDTREALRSVAFQAMSLATLGITIVAAALAWGTVVERFQNAQPLEVRGRPEAIVWDERVFRSEAQLARFLRGRGISYERWARNHPDAVAILRPAPIVVAKATTNPKRESARSANRAPLAAAVEPRLSAAALVMPVAALIALALAIGATAVSRGARRDGVRLGPVASLALKYRLYVFAAAAGVAVAVLITVAP